MKHRRHHLLPVLAMLLAVPALAEARPPRVPPAKMPPLPPAVIDDTLDIAGDDIEARKVRTRMTVEVQVNGQGPYRFVVDSGADSTVIGSRIARVQQLPAGTPVTLNAMTGTSRVERVLVDELLLGQAVVRGLELPVLEEVDLGGDGMIGIDALAEQRLMMDFEKKLIKVEDARLPTPRYDGEIVVTARRRRGQLILTEVRAAGLPVDAVVDTGSELTIGNLALRDKLIRGNRDKFTTVAISGVTGVTVNLDLAYIRELRLGSVTLRHVPIAFADVPPFTVFGLSDTPSLMLGTDLLATFRKISLDFRKRKVRFQLRRCETTGIVIRSSPSASLTRLSAGDNQQVCKR